jgi:hypothetical protein
MRPKRAGLLAPTAAALLALVSVPGSSALSGSRIETRQVNTTLLQSGDLVFRAGRGWEADAVRVMTQTVFSHVGIIERDERGRIFVIHAAPPENGGRGYVERVTLAAFNAPHYASDIVFYRQAGMTGEAGARTVDHARILADRRVPFDEDFDLADSGAIYCTELVLIAYAESGSALSPERLARNRFSIVDNVVFPADLLRSGSFTEIDAVDRS